METMLQNIKTIKMNSDARAEMFKILRKDASYMKRIEMRNKKM
jgi:hypothetical protein